MRFTTLPNEEGCRTAEGCKGSGRETAKGEVRTTEPNIESGGERVRERSQKEIDTIAIIKAEDEVTARDMVRL